MAISEIDLESKRVASEQAQTQYGQMSTRATTLPDILSEALNKKFGEANPLIQQRGTALENFLKAGTAYNTESAQRYLPTGEGADVIFSPTETRNLLSQQRAAASVPLFGLNTIIGASYGGIQNVVDSATRAYMAQVQAQQQAAEMARQSYQDLWAQYQFQEQQRQAAASAAAMGGVYGNQAGGQPAQAGSPSAMQYFQSILATVGKDYNRVSAAINADPNLSSAEKKQQLIYANKLKPTQPPATTGGVGANLSWLGQQLTTQHPVVKTIQSVLGKFF